jgi:hypothetical protein
VLANQEDAGSAQTNCLRTKQAKLAVADYGNAMAGFDGNSFHDAACRSQRFRKNGVLINHHVRNGQQVCERQTQKVSVRAVASNYAENGPCGAVTRITRHAQRTRAAAGVNLPDNSLPYQLIVCRFFHHAHKLMSDCAFEAGITTSDFEIGIADAGKMNTHQRLIATLRLGNFLNRQVFFVDSKGFHGGRKFQVSSSKFQVQNSIAI